MSPFPLQKRFRDWILGQENMRYRKKPSGWQSEGGIKNYSNMLPAFPGLFLGGSAPSPSVPSESFGVFRFPGREAKEGDTFSSLSQEYLNDPSWDWFIAEWNETGSLKAGQTIIIPLKPDRRGGLTLRGYQTVPVLAYHNFSPGKSDKMTVSQEMFDQQMSL